MKDVMKFHFLDLSIFSSWYNVFFIFLTSKLTTSNDCCRVVGGKSSNFKALLQLLKQYMQRDVSSYHFIILLMWLQVDTINKYFVIC